MLTKYSITFLSAFLLLFAGNVFAQSSDPAIGVWKTIDDKTNEAASLIKIEQVNGALEGTIVKTFQKPNEKPLVYCNLCKDERKDKPPSLE
ncbi:DUF2147 domain-containing protein [Polynucleobacter necessarius]|uniref:DUF2147 domain-containing protein n=1 Tax=Polynucleobacter necessarius TaxID=576610 RepID=UPI000E08E56F|nr:DUF2147 domain-containing protein [Polynucleobacter necessarius]